jgi:hypothetical protein
MQNVRLTNQQIEGMCRAFHKSFPTGDRLYLFGSRTDLLQRGGDIDLYVETSLNLKEAFCAKIVFARELFLECDDQKIDIVIRYQGAKEQLIYQVAKESGVQLS